MSSRKSQKKKKVLSKAFTQNRRIPLFVVAKTKKKVIRNKERRNWRETKLKVKEK
ncbi:MAG: 50S ribosomal protein L39e [Candidatus Micrarchaeia archaeon]